MAIFRYDPAGINRWSNTVVNYLEEDVATCSKKFNEQIQKLVQPNVWTGAAAAQNYHDFMDTHNALLKFINSFGSAFQEAMTSVNKNVANLEAANLGKDSNVGESLSLNYSQINEIAEQNINKEVVIYDYAIIIDIGGNLNTIRADLKNVYENLKKKIAEVNNGSGLWDGDAAENAENELSRTLTTNMEKVLEYLEKCISNIKGAGENAQNADRA